MPIPEQYRKKETPKWYWWAGGLVIGVLGYFYYKNKSSSASTSSASSPTAPTLESSGWILPQTTQILPQNDQWPYNQLSLPYPTTSQVNASGSGGIGSGCGVGDALCISQYTDPQSAGFVGYSQSPVNSGG